MSSKTNYACRVTEENVDQLISFVKDYGLNIDYLKDNLQVSTEDGYEIYGFFSCNNETGSKTWTELEKEGFFSYWRFVQEENTKSPWLQIVDRKL